MKEYRVYHLLKKNYLALLVGFLSIAVILLLISTVSLITKSKKLQQKQAKLTNEQEVQTSSQVVYSPTPTLTVAELKPILELRRIETPIIDNYNDYYTKFTITLPTGWALDDYRFLECKEKTSCEYYLQLMKADKPEYKLSFRLMDASFGNCEYEEKSNDPEAWEFFFPEFQSIQTNFGELRIGKSDKDNHWGVCQKNVMRLAQKSTDWMNVTDLGFVGFSVPNNYNQQIFSEMIEILRSVKLEKVKPM